MNETDWFSEAVSYVADNGIMNGVSETEFAPHNTTTRAMLVTMLYRLEGEPEASSQNEFPDVEKGSYYEKAVIWAKENGIINGDGNNLMPKASAERCQVAAIFTRFCELNK